MAAAPQRNGVGRLTTIDVNPDSGYLIRGIYADVVDRVIGESVEVIREGDEAVQMFVHDSLHSYANETAELSAVEARLSPQAVVLSDNAHATYALMDWAERTGRQFAFFAERPADHWCPGEGIGAAWDLRDRFGGIGIGATRVAAPSARG